MIGAIFAALLSVWKQPITAPILARVKFLGDVAKYASIWQLIVGGLLYRLSPAEFNAKPAFFVKMGLYVVGGIMSGLLLKRQGARAKTALEGGQSSVVVLGIRNILLMQMLFLITMVAIGVALVSGGK